MKKLKFFLAFMCLSVFLVLPPVTHQGVAATTVRVGAPLSPWVLYDLHITTFIRLIGPFGNYYVSNGSRRFTNWHGDYSAVGYPTVMPSWTSLRLFVMPYFGYDPFPYYINLYKPNRGPGGSSLGTVVDAVRREVFPERFHGSISVFNFQYYSVWTMRASEGVYPFPVWIVPDFTIGPRGYSFGGITSVTRGSYHYVDFTQDGVIWERYVLSNRGSGAPVGPHSYVYGVEYDGYVGPTHTYLYSHRVQPPSPYGTMTLYPSHVDASNGHPMIYVQGS